MLQIQTDMSWSSWKIRLLCMAALAIPMFSMRNGLFEFCTTRSWGVPLPAYTRYCPCLHKGAAEVYWTGLLLDLVFLTIAGVMLAGLIELVRHRYSAGARQSTSLPAYFFPSHSNS
jgi:hypothetical protein